MSLAIKDTMQMELTKRLSSKISDNDVSLHDTFDEVNTGADKDLLAKTNKF